MTSNTGCFAIGVVVLLGSVGCVSREELRAHDTAAWARRFSENGITFGSADLTSAVYGMAQNQGEKHFRPCKERAPTQKAKPRCCYPSHFFHDKQAV